MADESELKFKLDLDNKAFIEKMLASKGAISELGEAKNFTALTSHLLEVGAVVGTVGVAFLALKTTMDTVFEAENIKAINAQFELLSLNAGISTETLRDGLVKAAAGLVDDNELLAAANKALVSLGAEAGQIPQVMELARKATSVFGGDLVGNFEMMNQAIATGNMRLLKHIGIKIDQKKAYEDFAKEHNIAVELLTEDAKKQAIMNAVLEKGNTQFKGVNPNIKEATNLWQEMKTTLTDTKDIIVLAYDKFMGPTVINGFKILNGWLTTLKDNIKLLTMSQEDMRKQADKDIGLRGSAPEPPKKTNTEWEDKQKKQELMLKGKEDFETQTRAMEKESFDYRQTLEQNEIAADNTLNAQKEIANRDYQIKRATFIKEFQNNELIDHEEYMIALNNMEGEHAEKMNQMEEEREKRHLESMQRQLSASQNAAQGISAAFKYGAMQASQDLTNWGKTGDIVFNAFKKNSKQALLEFGAGHKSAADAMKMFMFGAIADTAEAKGEEMLLASIYPPNPAGMAGGAGLIALSGFLRSQAGGGSSGFGGVGSGGAGPGGTAETPTTTTPQKPHATMQVNVHGSIFDSEATGTRMMEIMRQAQDMQDFRLVQVGQK